MGISLAEKKAADLCVETLHINERIWAELCVELAVTLDRANKAYGNSTEKSAQILSILYPNGVQPEQMHDVRCTIDIIDKLGRIANDKDAFGESPWLDIAGYALLGYRHDLNKHPDRLRSPKSDLREKDES